MTWKGRLNICRWIRKIGGKLERRRVAKINGKTSLRKNGITLIVPSKKFYSPVTNG